MRDSCERSDPNGMGRPSFSAQTGVTMQPGNASLRERLHCFHSVRNRFYNRIMVHRRACSQYEDLSTSGQRQAAGVVQLPSTIRPCHWAICAYDQERRYGPQGLLQMHVPVWKDLGEINYAPPQKIFYR